MKTAVLDGFNKKEGAPSNPSCFYYKLKVTVLDQSIYPRKWH